MLMSFPTRSRGDEDLWFVCLFRGAAKGAGSLMIFFFFFGPSGCLLGRRLSRTAAEAPPVPCIPMPVPCIPMRRPGLPPGMLPSGEVSPQPAASLRRTKAPLLPARLLRACHGPNGLIRGTANPIPALLSLGQLDGRAVHRQPAWPWLTWLPTG